MENIITLARQIGKELQASEAYANFQTAQTNSDKDETLQGLIGEFNLKRMAINQEAQNPERSEEKLAELNTELRGVYASIMQNENMQTYNVAKGEIDMLLQRVTTIISLSAEGQDPETADFDPASCGGDCSGCGGGCGG